MIKLLVLKYYEGKAKIEEYQERKEWKTGKDNVLRSDGQSWEDCKKEETE